jgi:preprotein translocase subunit SecG
MSRNTLLITLAAVVAVLIIVAFLANREGGFGIGPFGEGGYGGSPTETAPQQPQP